MTGTLAQKILASTAAAGSSAQSSVVPAENSTWCVSMTTKLGVLAATADFKVDVSSAAVDTVELGRRQQDVTSFLLQSHKPKGMFKTCTFNHVTDMHNVVSQEQVSPFSKGFLHVSSVSDADTNTFHHDKDVGHTDHVCYPPLTDALSSFGTRNNLGMSELQNRVYERSDDHLEGGITGLPFNNLNNLGSSSLCDLLQPPTDVNVKLNTPSILPMSVRKEGTGVIWGAASLLMR
jgi:hypothetical protein